MRFRCACAVWRVIAWTFRVFQSGVLPQYDWNGTPWEEGIYRTRFSGSICDGAIDMYYCQTLRDMKYIKNNFDLGAGYSSEEVCIACGAKKSGPIPYCPGKSRHVCALRPSFGFSKMINNVHPPGRTLM